MLLPILTTRCLLQLLLSLTNLTNVRCWSNWFNIDVSSRKSHKYWAHLGVHGMSQNVILLVQGTCVEQLAWTLRQCVLLYLLYLAGNNNFSLFNVVSVVKGAWNLAACGSSVQNSPLLLHRFSDLPGLQTISYLTFAIFYTSWLSLLDLVSSSLWIQFPLKCELI